MARHDYINKKPKRSSKKSTKKVLPLKLIALAVVLFGLFVFGLWYIKQNAVPTPPKPQATVPKVKQEKPIPQPPEFIEGLKNQEVKVPVKQIKSRGPYQMQCGSFRTYEQAETRKAAMAFAGLIAEVRRTEGKNGVWFRVRLGPYETKRQAESDKNKLRRIKIVDCGIWLWT